MGGVGRGAEDGKTNLVIKRASRWGDVYFGRLAPAAEILMPRRDSGRLVRRYCCTPTTSPVPLSHTPTPRSEKSLREGEVGLVLNRRPSRRERDAKTQADESLHLQQSALPSSSK